MRTKNTLPIQWMIGVVVFLMLVVNGMHQRAVRLASSGGSDVFSSQNNFFTFLADMVGLGGLIAPSNGSSHANNGPNQNNSSSGQRGAANAGSQQNMGSTSVENGPAGQGGPNSAQQKNNTENNAEINAENGAENNLKDSLESISERDSGINAETNSELNAENNPDNNPGTNAETNSENSAGNSGSNPSSNSETNADQGSGNNNSGNNTDQGPGNSGGNSGNNSGDNSGNGSGNGPGNNPGFLNPSNFPTINPIPSDQTVSISITSQNQQNDSLNALVSSRQALVVPVQQQAQASKYQTVNSQSIPAPGSTQPPADVEAKVQSKQVTFH